MLLCATLSTRASTLRISGLRADEVLRAVDEVALAAQDLALVVEALELDALVDLDLQLREVDRLLDEIRGPFPDGADRVVDPLPLAHRDDDRVAVVGLCRAHEVLDRALDRLHVEDHDVEHVLVQSLEGARRFRGNIDGEPLGAEVVRQPLSERGFRLQDEKTLHDSTSIARFRHSQPGKQTGSEL